MNKQIYKITYFEDYFDEYGRYISGIHTTHGDIKKVNWYLQNCTNVEYKKI